MRKTGLAYLLGSVALAGAAIMPSVASAQAPAPAAVPAPAPEIAPSLVPARSVDLISGNSLTLPMLGMCFDFMCLFVAPLDALRQAKASELQAGGYPTWVRARWSSSRGRPQLV